MGKKFTKIPQNTFDNLQLDAGVLLKSFNPASPALVDSNIISATKGGIKVECKPSYEDFGEDVDNVPNNTKELKHLSGWDCSISTTILGLSPELIRLGLGAADIDGTNTTKVVPRAQLLQSDFSDIWWVGDKADGGFVAVKMLNALSTDGISIQTNKNSKGETSLTLTGHVSINAQDTVPMEFYSSGPTDADSTDLQSLTVTISTEAQTLTPTFSASVLNYTLSTTSTSATITAAAKTAATSAVITIRKDNTTITNGASTSLDLGENVFTITNVNNGVSKTYTLTITRTAGA